MAVIKTEMFGQFVYSPELSYEDLHVREKALVERVGDALVVQEADFINFEEHGDSLHVQCTFTAHEERIFHDICQRIVPVMDGMMEGRLFFVRKDLSLLTLYTLSHEGWQEAFLALPQAGAIGKYF